MRRTCLPIGLLLLLEANVLVAQEPALRLSEIGDVTAVGSSVEWLRPSADGRHFVFTVQAHGEAWVFDRRDRTLVRLATGNTANPVWAPEGKGIAFARADVNETRMIWTIADAGRGILRRVSAHAGDGPVFSPDGALIAYNRAKSDCPETDRGCRPALVVVPVRGGPEREIAVCCSLPFAWSGDGRWIYYHRFDRGYHF
jgi:Tol biopolymer transport system component